jgi:copper chaperone CopZ
VKTTTLELEELPSLGSEPIIEDALRVIRGVHEVKVALDARRVTVGHDENVAEEELAQAVRTTGVKTEVVSPERAEGAS